MVEDESRRKTTFIEVVMKIYLRPVTENDGKMIVKWRNAPQVARHCFSKEAVTEESNLEFFRNCVQSGKYIQFIVERIEEISGVASYPIATTYFKDVDNTNHRCELCLFTSDDEEWNTESQTIAIKMMLEKAFNEMGMNKVYSYMFAEYDDEKELLEMAGFHEEAVLRKEYINADGRYGDVYRMVIFETDFKDKK